MAQTLELSSAMEANGAYRHRHAGLEASGAAFALTLLEGAIRDLTFEDDGPVVVADYGSPQGRNSLAPMRVAIKALRARLGARRPIFLFRVSQPGSECNELFKTLEADLDRCVLDEPNVFPGAMARSVYDHVFPSDHVHLGWSSSAAVWLNRVPAAIPGHFVALRSTGAERAAFDRQAAVDWEAFLGLRARELQYGGRLVVVLPAVDDDGVSGLEDLFDSANQALAEMVEDQTLTPHERARMVLPVYPRRRCELRAPFKRDGHFQGLAVEHCDIREVPDAAWLDYQRHGDRQTLADSQAQFFCSNFAPALASTLTRASDAGAVRAFADRLQSRLQWRLAGRPTALHSLVSRIVLAKRGAW